MDVMDVKEYMHNVAARVISRQINRDCKGFLKLTHFCLTHSQTQESYSEIAYIGTVCFVKDAAVWTENSGRNECITALAHFEEIPTTETYNSNGNRIYQIWRSDTILTFTGKTLLTKTKEGWFAIDYWNRGGEATLNSVITSKDVKPTEYLIANREGDNVQLTFSIKPFVSLPAPTPTEIRNAFEAYLAKDGLEKLVEFNITKHETDTENSSGSYRYSSVSARVKLAYLQPVVKLQTHYNIRPVPKVGELVPENVGEKDWINNCYWDAGTELEFEVEISYRKEHADRNWGNPTIKAIDPVISPMWSEHYLCVQYKNSSTGMIIGEASVVNREEKKLGFIK